MENKKIKYGFVKIDKLIHGGQGIGTIENGKKALVFGVLPGERVEFRITKKRSDYVEGVVSDVHEASPQRIQPKDELYLSTSPWQIMSYADENQYKKEILSETIARAKILYDKDIDFISPDNEWHYRNKMEYSFWGDDDGVHLALFNRGTHQKQTVTGSSIARPEIDEVAGKLCNILNTHNARGGDLKSVILRCNTKGEVVVALFTRNPTFKQLPELEQLCKGVIVVYSNPKSPASVRTQDLYQYGDISLTDQLDSKDIQYDVFSFFQVNIPIFEKSLHEIKQAIGAETVVDMYSGVGSIGLSIATTKSLIESDEHNVIWAEKNAATRKDVSVIKATSETALDHINSVDCVIVDPPRAGLHKDLTSKLLEEKPPKIAYLSCNPSTQARDLSLLQESYKVESITGYNFFPRTPHIESLAILVRK